jgi:hypothetical protein
MAHLRYVASTALLSTDTQHICHCHRGLHGRDSAKETNLALLVKLHFPNQSFLLFFVVALDEMYFSLSWCRSIAPCCREKNFFPTSPLEELEETLILGLVFRTSSAKVLNSVQATYSFSYGEIDLFFISFLS